jgi:hypothetical protein
LNVTLLQTRVEVATVVEVATAVALVEGVLVGAPVVETMTMTTTMEDPRKDMPVVVVVEAEDGVLALQYLEGADGG